MRAPAEPLMPPRTASPDGAAAAFALALAVLLSRVDGPLLGALAGGIRADLWVNDAALGGLATAFALAHALALPALAVLAARHGRTRLLPAGLALLGLATLLAGAAPLFVALLAARVAAGAGQAAPAALAPALLDDLQLGRRRARAAALAGSAVPAGAALGYGLAGAGAPWLGWRGTFGVAGALVLALALALALALRRLREPLPSEGGLPPIPGGGLVAANRALPRDRVQALTLAGHTLLAFALAALAFWAPAFLERARGVPVQVGAFQLAAIAVMSGLGSPLAARLLEGALGRRTRTPAPWAAASSCAAAAALAWLAIAHPWPGVYLAALALAFLLLFAALHPAATALARAGSAQGKAGGAALGLVAALVLGDAAAPIAVGALSDAWNLWWAFLAIPLAALLAAAAFAAAGWAGRSR